MSLLSAIEAWFASSRRTDVNAGVNTREKLLEVDPQLAALVGSVLGQGAWRYEDTSPRPLVSYP